MFNITFCQAAYAMHDFIVVQFSAQIKKPRSWSLHLNCPPWPRVVGVIGPHTLSIDERAPSGESPDGSVLRDHASVAELHAVGL